MKIIFAIFLLLSLNSLSQVKISVIDQGIDKSHPLFKNKINSIVSVIENDSNTEDEVDGHGTHVAGIIIKESKANVNIQIIKTNQNLC